MARELAEQLHIPSPYLAKLLQQPCRVGWLSSTRGRGGGFTLTPGTENITLLEILMLSKGERISRECLLGFKECDAKLGMFIHWGVSQLLQDGEWVMNNHGITAGEYETLAPYSTRRLRRAGVGDLAKSRGMKYITLITKHHDGLALWDSQGVRLDDPRRTPFKRDIVRELADECQRQGIKLFFYYSQLDWHHPDYFPRGETGRTTGRPNSGDWPRYLDYMDAQLTELLTGLRPARRHLVRRDVGQARRRLAARRTYALIHRLQPAALIIPNHHKRAAPGRGRADVRARPAGREHRGLQHHDRRRAAARDLGNDERVVGLPAHRSQVQVAANLIHLVRAAGMGRTFCSTSARGPTAPFRRVGGAAARHRRLAGAYGASIYGTRAGPIAPRRWGVTTQSGDTVYVHVLDWSDQMLALPSLGVGRWKARMWPSGAAVQVTASRDGLTLTVPAGGDSPDRIVVLTRR